VAGTLRHSVEEVAVAPRRRPDRAYLTGEPFGELHIAAARSFDDLEVIDESSARRGRSAWIVAVRMRTWMNMFFVMSAMSCEPPNLMII